MKFQFLLTVSSSLKQVDPVGYKGLFVLLARNTSPGIRCLALLLRGNIFRALSIQPRLLPEKIRWQIPTTTESPHSFHLLGGFILISQSWQEAKKKIVHWPLCQILGKNQSINQSIDGSIEDFSGQLWNHDENISNSEFFY